MRKPDSRGASAALHRQETVDRRVAWLVLSPKSKRRARIWLTCGLRRIESCALGMARARIRPNARRGHARRRGRFIGEAAVRATGATRRNATAPGRRQPRERRRPCAPRWQSRSSSTTAGAPDRRDRCVAIGGARRRPARRRMRSSALGRPDASDGAIGKATTGRRPWAPAARRGGRQGRSAVRESDRPRRSVAEHASRRKRGALGGVRGCKSEWVFARAVGA
jgi:hypothetical protein